MGRREAQATGTAGASARREYERRRQSRERRIRARHPRVGGLLLALREEPQSERAWATGAAGEKAVAAALMSRCEASVVLLHDRGIPGSCANLDHIAVAPSGVWVIDSKKYKGRVEVRQPLLGDARLIINRRDRSKLADGLARQVAAVAPLVGADVPVHGVLCLVDAELPLLTTLKFRGYPLVRPRKLAKMLNASGPLAPADVRALGNALGKRLQPA